MLHFGAKTEMTSDRQPCVIQRINPEPYAKNPCNRSQNLQDFYDILLLPFVDTVPGVAILTDGRATYPCAFPHYFTTMLDPKRYGPSP